MALQNRVTPFGNLIAIADRGTLMGNRGVLHDEHKTIVRNRGPRRDWVTCSLSFKGCKQTIMRPKSYTQLFFLDEAVAFAAGHRPCSTCRREEFVAFKQAWTSAGLADSDQRLLVTKVDPMMAADRIDRHDRKVTYRAAMHELPAGAMIARDAEPDVAWLLWKNQFWRWSPAGYSDPRGVTDEVVTVLTPRCSVRVLSSGYGLKVHESACG